MRESQQRIFAVAATADRPGAGIAVLWFALHADGYQLAIVDYDVWKMGAVNADWIRDLFRRSAALSAEHEPEETGCLLRVEHMWLARTLRLADDALRDTAEGAAIDRSAFGIKPITEYEAAKWPQSFDDRAFGIAPLVNTGRIVRFGRGLERLGRRALRVNRLKEEIHGHRRGETASELLQAFTLGVLLASTPKPMSWFSQSRGQEKPAPSKGPFGPYVQGRRPM